MGPKIQQKLTSADDAARRVATFRSEWQDMVNPHAAPEVGPRGRLLGKLGHLGTAYATSLITSSSMVNYWFARFVFFRGLEEVMAKFSDDRNQTFYDRNKEEVDKAYQEYEKNGGRVACPTCDRSFESHPPIAHPPELLKQMDAKVEHLWKVPKLTERLRLSVSGYVPAIADLEYQIAQDATDAIALKYGIKKHDLAMFRKAHTMQLYWEQSVNFSGREKSARRVTKIDWH